MRRLLDEISHETIGACIEVHRALGPGLLESAYEECIARELMLRGLAFERQVPLALSYKGVELANAYRIDLLIESRLVLELKCVERLLPVHQAQTLTYLRIGNLPMGLLINLHAAHVRGQIRRYIRSELIPENPL